jgi:hypothetical protein
MKIVTRILACVLLTGMLYAFSGVSMAPDNNAASITSDFTCGMFDGDGGFVVVFNATHSVITSSGHTTLICHASDVPNSTGHAVRYDDFPCGTFLGGTTDSHETVSNGGAAVLRCRI